MTQAERWLGSLTIGDGWAILEGVSGDNAQHEHLAHQLTTGLDCELFVASAGGARNVPLARYAIIPSGVSHALGPTGSRIRSLYLDRANLDLPEGFRSDAVSIADEALSMALQEYKGGHTAPADWLHRPQQLTPLGAQREALITAVETASYPASPRRIANDLGLSPSRLSQLSHATFGAPISHVLQWRQLQRSARALSLAASLAEAAHAGGFSDQAHFTRRMRRWFGISPGAGLSSLDIKTDPAAPIC